MDVEIWCSQDNVTKVNGYYCLRRVRKGRVVQAVVRETGQFQISKQLSFEAERHRLHKTKGI